MVTITQLLEFSVKNNNTDWIAACENYINETKSDWSHGKYYFGGQIPLDLDDTITDQIIKDATNKNKIASRDVYNSFEMGSVQRHLTQFNKIIQIIESYTNLKNVI